MIRAPLVLFVGLVLLGLAACSAAPPSAATTGGGPDAGLSVDPGADGGTDLGDAAVAAADLAGTTAAPPDSATRAGTFVAVGYGGRRLFSADNGLTWSSDVADVPGDNNDDQHLIRDVGWGNGTWLTAGGFNGWTWRSSDGKSWDGKNPISQWFGGIAYGKGTWVAVGGTGRRSSSSDGVTWKDSYDSGAANGYRCLGLRRLPGRPLRRRRRRRARQHLGQRRHWTIGTGVSASLGLQEVVFGGGVFVATAGGTNVVRSVDGGASWSAATPPAGIDGITFGQGHFVAVGGSKVLTSSDERAWSPTSVAGIGGTVAYGNGTFVALQGGSTYTSTDAVHWSAHANVPSGSNIMRVRFGGVP